MTLLVNLFAGPGAGKSTTAAQVFAGLKGHGVCAEMALEFAKDLTWEKRYSAMNCQPYVFGEQLYRIQRLVNAEVEVVITDSPLLLSIVYGPKKRNWREFVCDTHDDFDNLNFFIKRVKPYDPRGRRQSEESALAVDAEVLGAMGWTAYSRVPGDASGAECIVDIVMRRLGK